MEASVAVGNTRQDMKILGLISTGHFMSHFYFMALPPLFPFLRDSFGVSYTELGVLMSAIYGTSTITPDPDRVHGRSLRRSRHPHPRPRHHGCRRGSNGAGAASFWVLVALGVLRRHRQQRLPSLRLRDPQLLDRPSAHGARLQRP